MLGQVPAALEEIFHAAADLKAEAREAFLRQACGTDREMRRVVDSLLAADSDPVSLHSPLPGPSHVFSDPGDSTLERYRLLERIGAGGMGLVYKAVRADDEYSKLVAIKIVQHGAGESGNAALVARFRQERQILAGLEHTNIARLLDGGTTPEGLPFLVMDFVEGVPIDRYLTAAAPSQRAVLELFRQLCSAVSFAHQTLVVHRDLKPANILVTADGTPKLLDFGIARLVDGSAQRTITGLGAMTPEYASPEQIRGGPITTATDIYSLGVLLYEMLCGARPYRKAASAMELAHAICTETPVGMIGRNGKPVDPDLENIVQMALRKEPERRYASVEQFSEDLRRYLDGYPVAARAATTGYRLRRFAGRNKASIAAAALLLLTLLAGIATTSWEAHLANQRFNDVRALANSYLFEFHDAIKDLPGSTPARRLVVRRGLQYLDSLAQQRGHDVSLGRELANAYDKVASVQGEANTPSLGDHAGALISYRKAVAIREPLFAADPRNGALGVELSGSYIGVSQLLQFTGDLKGSAATARKAVALLEKLASTPKASVTVRAKLAVAYCLLGDVTGNNEVQNLGDPKEAMRLIQKARDIQEGVVAEDPGDREKRYYLGDIYGRIAALEQALDDKAAAVVAFRRYVVIEEKVVWEDPLNTRYRRDAAVGHRSLALMLLRLGNLPEAQENGDRSALLFEQLAKEDPANVQAQEELADSYYSQGYLREKADGARALKYYDDAIVVYTRIDHPGYLPGGMRTTYQLMAALAVRMKDPVRVIRNAKKELEIDDRLIAADAANAGAWRNRGVAWTQIGQARELAGDWSQARVWYQKALDLWTDMKNKGTLIPMYAVKLNEAKANIARIDKHP